MENLAETIRNVPLFSYLSREDLARIVPKFEERRGTRRENGLYLRARLETPYMWYSRVLWRWFCSIKVYA